MSGMKVSKCLAFIRHQCRYTSTLPKPLPKQQEWISTNHIIQWFHHNVPLSQFFLSLVITAVGMVDVSTQSETEDLSDVETRIQDRKPSLLQVVPEEEHEDDELVATFI